MYGMSAPDIMVYNITQTQAQTQTTKKHTKIHAGGLHMVCAEIRDEVMLLDCF